MVGQAELAAVLAAARRRVRGGRDRHRPAVRRRDARGARPQRPAAPHLQSRGDVAQERPHRARDDRPARLRARACLARREPRRRRRRRRRRRHRARARRGGRVRAARRSRRSGRRQPRRSRRRSPTRTARSHARSPAAAVGLPGLARVERIEQHVRPSAASSCGAGDERDRPQRTLARQRQLDARRAASGRPRLRCAPAPAIRTPS